MTISGNSVGLSVTLPVHGSQAPQPANILPSGKSLPPNGQASAGANLAAAAATATAAAATAATVTANAVAAAAPATAATAALTAQQAATAPAQAAAAQTPGSSSADPAGLVSSLNKYLNDSGRPDQFRLAPEPNSTLIQQINPASGAVIAEYSAAEFPVLARSTGATATGTVFDGTA